MEHTKDFGKKQDNLNALLQNQDFIDFFCYKEDKWLQTAEFEEKLKAVFGSVERAIKEFRKDTIFNNNL